MNTLITLTWMTKQMCYELSQLAPSAWEQWRGLRVETIYDHKVIQVCVVKMEDHNGQLLPVLQLPDPDVMSWTYLPVEECQALLHQHVVRFLEQVTA